MKKFNENEELRLQIEKLSKKDDLIWKEKYQIVDKIFKGEKIYDKYKGIKRPKSPLQTILRENSFNPYIQYEKQNKFFEFNLQNLVGFTELLVHYPEWFYFFMKSYKSEDRTDWSITDHKKIEMSLRRRTAILYFILSFILSLIPIILCFFYSQIGILKMSSPSLQLTIFHFLLIEAAITPIVFSGYKIDTIFIIFPHQYTTSLIFIVGKQIFFIFCFFLFDCFWENIKSELYSIFGPVTHISILGILYFQPFLVPIGVWDFIQ